ncbi:CDP-diacylglycerol--serine O-phosphatidyltransferase [Clostridium thermobutyricum]|uniref:CDP-diacylglycerol--serine O-phosphatidyltransferase n=1 Tax=Clostridium thermobutyricum DSM 4928 TaxID=1121339 RepID=A0A1V4SWD8_9CLOT|nr:CDP-diacylglycerol--serine O-phosphatidyltransferase [Clostridium thermobutyricum]OPX48643.1 phosphatidylcholine synthase [Clostridium thermobutyricum DSM 4928]
MKKSCIPNIFTFINLSCGVLSLLSVFDERYLQAAIFIILAALVDRYDGRVARYLNVSSELGKELDSLADLVSFGVAPSILIFVLFHFSQLGPKGILGYAILLAFPICGAFRLARYNVSTFDGNFRGIPITIAGCFMAVYAIISLYVKLPVLLTVILMIIGSYLMVSNIKLKKL